MKSPGTLLREAREQRGLTLDDVGAMTRVPKTMLAHLEEDRFEEYEAEVFARGHLRSYAREVGADVEEVLEAYERHTGRRKTDPLEEAQREGRIKTETPGPKPIPKAAEASSDGDAGQADGMGLDDQFGLRHFVGGLQRTHLVAIVLVLVGLFVMFAYIGSPQVTAQDEAQFEEPEQSEWDRELEDDIEDTRWQLEQAGQDDESGE